MFACGFACDSISGLNNTCAVEFHLRAQGVGRTGSTGQAPLKLIAVARPVLTLMACVKNLSAGANVGKLSDLQVFIKALNEIGYICIYGIYSPMSYGFPQTRDRWYVFVVLVLDIVGCGASFFYCLVSYPNGQISKQHV